MVYAITEAWNWDILTTTCYAIILLFAMTAIVGGILLRPIPKTGGIMILTGSFGALLIVILSLTNLIYIGTGAGESLCLLSVLMADPFLLAAGIYGILKYRQVEKSDTPKYH